MRPLGRVERCRLLHRHTPGGLLPEVYAVMRGLHHLAACQGASRHYTIITDSQPAMRMLQGDVPVAGHGKGVIELAQTIHDQRNTITVRWVTSDAGRRGERVGRQLREGRGQFGNHQQ